MQNELQAWYIDDFMNKDVVCMEVIITNMERRGAGVENDPVRKITQVWTKDGELIAENDPFKPEHVVKAESPEDLIKKLGKDFISHPD